VIYRYAIGPDPYKSYEEKDDNGGCWRVKAENLDAALRSLFTSLSFPTEATGRYSGCFIPGVSIPYPDHEVIQVWSDDPAALRNYQACHKVINIKGERNSRGERYMPHLGDGKSIALLKEIHVGELLKYIETGGGVKLLGMGESSALSPVGYSISDFLLRRGELQHAMAMAKYQTAQKTWEVECVKREMQAKMKTMNTQMALMNLYLNGARETVWVNKGNPAPACKWRVFQTRQYLDQELALLANLRRFDFRNMEELDTWLMESGRVWKFLPFDRTILVTRVCRDRKDYGKDTWANIVFNEMNMRNFVWIRNGENVVRVGLEYDLDNRILPDANEFSKTLRGVQERMWTENYKSDSHKRWMFSDEKDKPDPKPGLKDKPHEEMSPLRMSEIRRGRFETVEEWLDSPEYKAMEPVFHREVRKYLAKKNREQMCFALLLQGIVDRGGILDIPPGTDLFDNDIIHEHFDLLYDYTHGLPDRTYQRELKPYQTGAKLGEWIITVAAPVGRGESYLNEAAKPRLFKVVDTKDGKPVVNYFPLSKHYKHQDDGHYRRVRLKTPIKLVVNEPYVRIEVPEKLAEKIIDDREWKMDHRWLVPLFANWRKIQQNYLRKDAKVNMQWIDIEGDGKDRHD
jgi:hypothetical protein